jgi:hypothetical protein
MRFVLDASVAAAWFFPDMNDAMANAAAAGLADETALVPALFWFEIRNLLVVGERRGRVVPSDTARFLTDLDACRSRWTALRPAATSWPLRVLTHCRPTMPATSSWRVATRCRSLPLIAVSPPLRSRKGSISFSDARPNRSAPPILPSLRRR